jgi:sec-independent protein translocase protein TatA
VNVGPFQILIIALVILVLFGRGRISDMMGDFGKGVKSFRRNLAEDEAAPQLDTATSDADAPVPTSRATDRSPN